MNASIEIQNGIKNLTDQPEIKKYFNNVGTPYVDVAEVMSQIPQALRHRGLTVNVAGIEYWWDTSDVAINPVIKLDFYKKVETVSITELQILLDGKEDKNSVVSNYYVTTLDELIIAWDEAKNSSLPTNIYAAGTLVIEAKHVTNGTLELGYGTGKPIAIIGVPGVGFNLGGYNLVMKNPVFENVSFSNPPGARMFGSSPLTRYPKGTHPGYIKIRNGYFTSKNVSFISDEIDATALTDILPHVTVVGTDTVNLSGPLATTGTTNVGNGATIKLDGVKHYSAYSTDNTNSMIQPFYVKFMAISSNQYFDLQNVAAVVEFERFSSVLFEAINTETRLDVNGDSSWFWNTKQVFPEDDGSNFSAVSSMRRKASFDTVFMERYDVTEENPKVLTVGADKKVKVSTKSVLRIATKAAILLPTTWTTLGVTPFKMMLVAIYNDTTNNGVYQLKGDDYQSEASWEIAGGATSTISSVNRVTPSGDKNIQLIAKDVSAIPFDMGGATSDATITLTEANPTFTYIGEITEEFLTLNVSDKALNPEIYFQSQNGSKSFLLRNDSNSVVYINTEKFIFPNTIVIIAWDIQTYTWYYYDYPIVDNKDIKVEGLFAVIEDAELAAAHSLASPPLVLIASTSGPKASGVYFMMAEGLNQLLVSFRALDVVRVANDGTYHCQWDGVSDDASYYKIETYTIKDLQETAAIGETDVFVLETAVSKFKISFTNLKAKLKEYFDTIYVGAVALLGKKNLHGIESYTATTWNDTTKILTLPACTYWYKGVKVVCAANITIDMTSVITAGGSNKPYYLFFDDGSGTIKARVSVGYDLKNEVSIDALFWNGTKGALTREKHNHTRNIDWHISAHLSIGARYISGLALSGLANAATAFSWAVASGSVMDEDQQFTVAAHSNSVIGARVWYQITGGSWTFADTTYPYVWNGTTSRVQYPNSSFVLTDLATNRFLPIYVYANGGDKDRQIQFVLPTTTTPYTSAANARAATLPDLSGTGFGQEFKLIHKIIVDGSGAPQPYVAATDDFRSSSSVPAGGSGSTPITVDQTIVENSSNAVAGGAVFTALANVSADGSYPLTSVTTSGVINQVLTPNRVFDIEKQLTNTLTLILDSTTRKATTTNDYMVQFSMGALQTILHPTLDNNGSKAVMVRWAEGVLPYISVGKTFFCTYTEKLIWTMNLYALADGTGTIVGSAWASQKHTLSFTPNGATVVTAMQAIATVTFYKATTNVTASAAFFTASMIGLHLYLGTTYAGQIQSITSTTVAVVSTSGIIGAVGSQQAGFIGGYISSSVAARQEFTFQPTISGAYLTTSTNFKVTVVSGNATNIQFEAREFASPYTSNEAETQQTIYIGNIETI